MGAKNYTRWEYKRISEPSNGDPVGVLNEYGYCGWEAVSVDVIRDTPTPYLIAYFKRPILSLDLRDEAE